jgi:hypothetical protein
MACALPAETGMPLARWSCAELAAEAVNRAVVESVSPSTVRRWLAEDAIKPWQYRSWIFPRDLDFAAKAVRVLDLYDRLWEGQPLGEDEYVIGADEKSQLQALRRRHPNFHRRGSGPAAGVRVPPGRNAGLPRRLRRPPRPGDGPMRSYHRDRAVHSARRAGAATW